MMHSALLYKSRVLWRKLSLHPWKRETIYQSRKNKQISLSHPSTTWEQDSAESLDSKAKLEVERRNNQGR